MLAKDCVRAVVASLVLVALVLGAVTSVSAQKPAFVDAFVAFHSALFGTYGDEGPEVTAALERMSASLGALDPQELTRLWLTPNLKGFETLMEAMARMGQPKG